MELCAPPDASALLEAIAAHPLGRGVAVELRAAAPAIVRRLPAFSAMGLEVHLGAAAPRTDLLLRLMRTELTQHRQRHDQDGAKKLPPPWPALLSLLSFWGGSESGPSALSSVENLWLEFDSDSAPFGSFIPSLFFDPDRDQRLPLEQKLAVIDSVFSTLHREPSQVCRAHLGSFIELAPPALQLYYCGLMLSRRSEAVRICLLGNSATTVLPYLKRIDWPGDEECLAALIARYAADADKIILDIDVLAGAQAPIGLEIFHRDTRKWEAFFSKLCAEKLCQDSEAAAVLSWPRATGNIVQRLNHVKLGLGASSEVRAKAYLYLCLT